MNSGSNKHPDIFTADEAAAFLGLRSTRSLETLATKYQLKRLPIGEGLYHRSELERVVNEALTAMQLSK